jgi:predicted NBD/HSP70 family sugar kinase
MHLLSPEISQVDPRIRFLRSVLREHWRDACGGETPAEALSVQHIAKVSDVSRPSVNKFNDHLIAAGRGTHGLVRLEPMAGYVIGVDLRETHPVRVAVRDTHGRNLIKDREVWEPETQPSSARADDLLQVAAQGIKACTEHLPEMGLDKGRLLGIGISLPGPVKDGLVVGPKASPWDLVRADLNLVRALGEQHLPDVDETDARKRALKWAESLVATQSDVYATAVLEHLWGDSVDRAYPDRPLRDTVMIKWSFDLCAAAILGGELHTGSGGMAGAIPHYKIDEDEIDDVERKLNESDLKLVRPPTCGFCAQNDVPYADRCIHAWASLQYLSSLADPSSGPDRPAAEAIKQAVLENRSEVIEPLKLAAGGIGNVVAAYVGAVDPASVTLGGAVGARVFDAVETSFVQRITSAFPGIDNTGLKVRGASLVTHTATLGAAACAALKIGPRRLAPFTEDLSAPKPKRGRPAKRNATLDHDASTNGDNGRFEPSRGRKRSRA